MARDMFPVRLTDAEKRRLAELATRESLTMAEYIRYVIRREHDKLSTPVITKTAA